jgi:hypothetical protein
MWRYLSHSSLPTPAGPFAYDVSELGFTYFLRTIEIDDASFLALPIFPVRFFRHSGVYINKTKGIERPQDQRKRREQICSA